MITFTGGRSLKLLQAFLMLLVQLRPTLGFISGVGAGHANNINCLEGERQALVEFKKGLVDDSGSLSSWGRKKNCCDWEGVYCSNQTSHVLELKLDNYGLQGRKDEYRELLGLLKVIDLSNNKLTGKLPIEICSLLELYSLNVSGNNLIGEIPHLIGQLKKVETVDLSRNQFLGEIPSSMSELSFLNHLNLSYNHLSGKIPSSTQLQSFQASDFAGNPGLCGLPLSHKCWISEQTSNQSEDGEEYRDEFWKWFYGAAGFGFVVGFLGVCSSLLLKDSWRHAYFLSLENMKDCLYVTMAVNIARLWRTFQRPG